MSQQAGERLQSAEQRLSEATERHRAEMGALRAAHSQQEKVLADHSKEVQSLKNFLQKQSSSERMDHMESALSESITKHTAAIAALRDMHSKQEVAFGKQSHEVDLLRPMQGQMATLAERLRSLEQILGESADGRSEELQSLKMEHLKLEDCISKQARDFASITSHSDKVGERIAYIERLLGDSSAKHAEQVASAHAKMDNMHAALSASLSEVRSANAGLAGDKDKLDTHHASLKERVECIERELSDSASRHAVTLEKAEQLHSRLSACEGHSNTLGRAHADLTREKSSLRESHASMQERLDYIENLLGDSAEKHDRGFQDLKTSHDKHAKELTSIQTTHASHQATMAERLAHLEKLLADSGEKHSSELDALRHGHSKHTEEFRAQAKDFATLKATAAHHDTVSQRLDHLEQRLGDSAEKHSAELAALRTAHSQHESALGKYSKDVDLLKLGNLQHSSLGDRIAHLEQQLGESSEKHSAALETLQSAHSKHAEDSYKQAKEVGALKVAAVQHAAMGNRLDQVEKLLAGAAEKHDEVVAAVHARLDQVHGRIQGCEVHTSGIGDLKKAHASLANEKAILDSHHTSLQERVDHLESLLGDSADRHAKVFERLDEIHGRLSTCEGLGSSLTDLRRAHSSLAGEKATLERHHATFRERLDALENGVGDSAERLARDVEALKAAQPRHEAAVARHGKEVQALRAAMAEQAVAGDRIAGLEELLAQAADRHAEEFTALKDAHTRHEVAISKHAKDIESNGRAVQELLAKEREKREEHHTAVRELTSYLEGLVGESADRQIRELEETKAAHTRLSAEAVAREARQSSVQERVARLERTMGGTPSPVTSPTRHGGSPLGFGFEVRGAQSKLERMSGRLAGVRDAWHQDSSWS